MILRRSTAWLPALVVVLLAGSCSDAAGPTDRTLTVRLARAPGDDGALIFRVRAAAPQTIDTLLPACTGCRIFWRRVNQAEVRVIVTGTLEPGDLVRVEVSDPGMADAYYASVVEGASRRFEPRAGTAYSLTVSR